MFRLLNIEFAASVKYHVWFGTGLIFLSLVHGGSTLFIWTITHHIEEEVNFNNSVSYNNLELVS